MRLLQRRLIENPLGKLLGYAHAYMDKCDRYQRYRRRFTIDPSFMFTGTDIILDGVGKIVLGANSYITHRSLLYAGAGTTLRVGRDCKVASDFQARTENYVADQIFSDKEAPQRVKGDIAIGDGCWIGQGVFIREGVTVGEQCVVGAGSVVTHDLPSYSICCGVPCEPIKYKKGWFKVGVEASLLCPL